MDDDGPDRGGGGGGAGSVRVLVGVSLALQLDDGNEQNDNNDVNINHRPPPSRLCASDATRSPQEAPPVYVHCETIIFALVAFAALVGVLVGHAGQTNENPEKSNDDV